MISLSKYLNSKFTVAGSESSKIILFDIDDTLITTDTKVLVVKDDEIIKRLSTEEYNFYKLKPGEEFDYREFNDIDILNRGEFTKYWRTLKREYSRGTHIGILTARSDEQMIRKFFLGKGVDIKRELIFAISDPINKLSGTIEERKSKIIEYLHKLGYNTFIFFDDNESNLECAEKIAKRLDIKVHTIKV